MYIYIYTICALYITSIHVFFLFKGLSVWRHCIISDEVLDFGPTGPLDRRWGNPIDHPERRKTWSLLFEVLLVSRPKHNLKVKRVLLWSDPVLSLRYIRLIRLALLFEKVCSLPDTKLSRGSLSFVVESLLPKKLEVETAESVWQHLMFNRETPWLNGFWSFSLLPISFLDLHMSVLLDFTSLSWMMVWDISFWCTAKSSTRPFPLSSPVVQKWVALPVVQQGCLVSIGLRIHTLYLWFGGLMGHCDCR